MDLPALGARVGGPLRDLRQLLLPEPTEGLFQGEGNIAFYHNLLVNEHGDAIRIQPHNDIPRRVVVAFNTVVASGAGVSVLQKEGAPHFGSA